MHAGCHIDIPEVVKRKKAVINVRSKDNACFAWSVIAALYPAEINVNRKSSYPHYSDVLNLRDVPMPVTLSGIKKFERLNSISINVYSIDEKNNCEHAIVPLRVADEKKEKHVNLLYVQDQGGAEAGHFVWIKNLSRLVSSQLSKKEHKKHICDRCLHYFSSNIKLQAHSVDCQQINNCAIVLPSEEDKWLSFNNHSRKERVPFVVYADLECVLKKTDTDTKANQHHQVFSIAYYVHCSYDNSQSTNDFDLLTRKGVFPYEYVDCADKLQDSRLPPRESFFSSLTGDTVSESDYVRAENVWKRFSIQTLGDYSDLYLKIDVLLLADIFENFRDSSINSYGLDPAYYYTLPEFTWDAMLKHTRINFELLTDIDMVMFVKRGIRGGLSKSSGRCARANNKHMQSYDPSKPSSYLMYFDVNNLYGWAMCQPLPYANFRWVTNVTDFNVNAIAVDSSTCYILEVDLEYPQHLHDEHTDLPFCPTRDKPPGKRQEKLLATVYDKKRYVIHYRNLQQCTRHGLRVTKIHRILEFSQSPWLRKYIELNTQFRTLAKNDFEKIYTN
ncbi:PREDICTED: uncharacterized protein LOC105556762 [Vollenhovia emeryi]|uniref:uncharacterized protein LOC105556762 n=1 Tax=Vollenhovia emeryi TaxID=411798 RepID=UPI0005F46163|nr:PREDICTED: uncharacterized protein LOC105556762 [Vollenhovia emeryi]